MTSSINEKIKQQIKQKKADMELLNKIVRVKQGIEKELV